jgi:hypothetical protein
LLSGRRRCWRCGGAENDQTRIFSCHIKQHRSILTVQLLLTIAFRNTSNEVPYLVRVVMLSESFVASILAQPRAPNTSIAKDVGIYLHELHPTPAIKSSFKKSSTLANALAVSSTHIFAPQAEKAVVHVYSREKGTQESLISFPERIHSAALVGDGVLVLGTAEGRVILWEVSVLIIWYSDWLLII